MDRVGQEGSETGPVPGSSQGGVPHPRDTIVGNECHVCGEVTLKTRLHYGGITCYSCRAFFRRACTKKKKDVCKRNNNCDVRLDERKRCGACRYVVCIDKGMKPHLVLSDEEKQQRFKNVHKRRAEMETAARMDDEEELDDFPSPHFGAASDFGAAGGSGERLAFRGEVPSPAKRRSGNFQPPPHPQVKQESKTSLDEHSGHVYDMPQTGHYSGGRSLEGAVSSPFHGGHPGGHHYTQASPPSQGNLYSQQGAVSPPSSLPSRSFPLQENLVYTPNASMGFFAPTTLPPTSSYPKAPYTSYPTLSPTTSYSTPSYSTLTDLNFSKSPYSGPFSSYTSASWSARTTSVISDTHRVAVMPGTARTSVIMLACKKEEKVEEETMLSEEKEDEVEEEQWKPNVGEKEKNILKLEEELKDMNGYDGGEIFEKALEVQEGREEPREDGPLDLTKYSFLYPETHNSATKKYFSLTKGHRVPPGAAQSHPPKAVTTSSQSSTQEQDSETAEQGTSVVEFKSKPTTDASVTSTPTSSTASSRQIVSKVYSNSAKQPIPSPEEMLETVMTINIAEFEHFYSVEENNYLTRFCNRGREKWLKVNFGTNQLQEFVNWCQFGGDLTAEFFKAANRQLNERYIRIMESTEEFPVMQAKDQLSLLRANIGLTQMLTYVRSINTATADEEMTNVFGESDLLIWEKIKDKVPVRRTTDMFMAIPMPKRDLQRFMLLVSQCKVPLLTDQRVFSLLVPLLVFTTNQPNLVLHKRNEVDAARDQYMTILHRYLHQKGEDVETKMKAVMEMIKAVKEMALLFNKANMSPALE